MEKERMKQAKEINDFRKAEALRDSILIGKVTQAINLLTEVMGELAARHRWDMFEPTDED